jgi:hypothetical protein
MIEEQKEKIQLITEDEEPLLDTPSPSPEAPAPAPAPEPKRKKQRAPMTPERKAILLANLAKGRETAKKRREAAKAEKLKLDKEKAEASAKVKKEQPVRAPPRKAKDDELRSELNKLKEEMKSIRQTNSAPTSTQPAQPTQPAPPKPKVYSTFTKNIWSQFA